MFKGALLFNNSLVMRDEVGEGSDGLTCTSENADCCNGSDAAATGSGWFSPDGSPLHQGKDGATYLYITRGLGYVRLNRITGGTPTLYWCVVPDRHGTLQMFYIGLYTSNPGAIASRNFLSVMDIVYKSCVYRLALAWCPSHIEVSPLRLEEHHFTTCAAIGMF